MAQLSTERVRIRRYECDVYGHLNNANYLRLLTLADESDPPAGTLVRAHVEFVRPVGPGDGVTITASTEEPTTGHERRSYRLTSQGSDVATAVFEYATGDAFDTGTAVAEPPHPPPGVYTMRRPVEWRDVGVDGAVPVAALAALAEDAGIRVVAAHAWPMTRCAAEGFAIVLRTIDVEMGASAGLDDEIRIETFASGMRRSMITRHYLLHRESDGAEIARFASLYVWVDLETNRPIRVPEVFIDDLRPNLVP
jgi:acyl-CoA thioesterase FadM